jgi:ABC-type lipoprotein export system ATPase subunit
MASTVRYIRAVGIHGRYDLELDFYPGVNILYGKNGTGKTTLLHILANILNADFERFAFLPFETIEVHLDDKRKINLRESANRENRKIDVYLNGKEIYSFLVSEVKEGLGRMPSPIRKPLLPTAYFPAFRTLIEASGQEEEVPSYQILYEDELRRRYFGKAKPGPNSIKSTGFARRFFGNFVPLLNYPSPEEVSRRLSAEMQKALNDIAATDRQLLSKAFLDIFATLSKESNPDVTQLDQVLEKTRTLLENTSIISDPTIGEEVYSRLRELVLDFKVRPGKEDTYVPILEVYKNSLEERAKVQEKSLKIINTYLNSVNRFLDDKQLILRKESPSALPTLLVQFHDVDLSKMQALSSGERQIVTLLYSVTHMSGQRVVLIDEPEISLHIDWQRLLIPAMATQLQDLQIITCTHSPMIASKYEDQMIKLEIKPTGRNGAHDDENIEEDTEEEL